MTSLVTYCCVTYADRQVAWVRESRLPLHLGIVVSLVGRVVGRVVVGKNKIGRQRICIVRPSEQIVRGKLNRWLWSPF